MSDNAQANKLSRLLGDPVLAEALVAAGLGTPGRIEAAQDSAIEEAVESENLAAVRAVFPAQE